MATARWVYPLAVILDVASDQLRRRAQLVFVLFDSDGERLCPDVEIGMTQGQSKRMRWDLAALLCILGSSLQAARLSDQPLVFTGMCDASAAVALSTDIFVAVNDEDNLLRFYQVNQPGRPFQTYDLKPLLSSRRKTPEADFEGAARLGHRVFFITSHGRSAQGKPAPLRHRFLALEFSPAAASRFQIQPVGRVYTNLLSDLVQDPRLARFGLAEASKLPPKAPQGLNIEALTDAPDGSLLIGFRSPLVEGRALLVPLLNPNEVITGQSPRFGMPRLLPLGGLGLRGIGSVEQGYYLMAGPTASDGECRIFFWKGDEALPESLSGLHLPGINPEGICFHDEGGKRDFLILSDDGTRSINGTECKSLRPEERQFRAFRIVP